MLDLPDPIFDEPAPPIHHRPRAAAPTATSPLRAWGMWGGFTALGLVAAASLAHAAASLLPPRPGPPGRGLG